MDIKIRHVDNATGKYFTTCACTELNDVIIFIQESGGVYTDGDYAPFHSYQLMLDETGAYCEILVGDD